MTTVKVNGFDEEIEFPDDMNEGEILSVLRKGFNSFMEPAAAITTAAMAEPIAGLMSIPALALGVDDAVKAQENIKEWMTYVPATEEGMESLQAVADVLAPVAEVFEMTSKGAGDYVYEKTGSPELAAIAYSAPTAALELLGLKGVRAAGDAGMLGKQYETVGLKTQSFGQAGAMFGSRTKDKPDDPYARFKEPTGPAENPYTGLVLEDPVIDRLVNTGLLKPWSADKAQQIKQAQNQYNKLLKESPTFRRKERLAKKGGFETDIELILPKEKKIITPSDLEGSALVAVASDRSKMARLRKLGGLPVNTVSQGGYEFNLHNPGWASNSDIAKQKQAHFKMAADHYDTDVVGMVNFMGENATSFATPITELLLQQIQQINIPKRDIKEFDEAFRKIKGGKDWVGLSDPRAFDQLTGIGDSIEPLAGGMRTEFIKLIEKEGFRKKGFPQPVEALRAINADELGDLHYGETGLSMFRTKPNEQATPFDDHNSYDTRIPGEEAMAFETSVPIQVAFPDPMSAQLDRWTALRDQKGNLKIPRKFTWNEAVNAINTATSRPDTVQIATPQWVDNVSRYIEEAKKVDPDEKK